MSEGKPYNEYAQKSDDHYKWIDGFFLYEWIDGFFRTFYLMAVGARRDVYGQVESHQESSYEDGDEIFRQE